MADATYGEATIPSFKGHRRFAQTPEANAEIYAARRWALRHWKIKDKHPHGVATPSSALLDRNPAWVAMGEGRRYKRVFNPDA